ncbi:MAG: M1 family peptidase, partial [Saprospiraceae bacterium]|nr:M1 family peptidase [Saprospiraceae bacterium]
MIKFFLKTALISLCCLTIAQAQIVDDKFAQIDEWLPTPNSYRTASGAPGHAYWQNEADYVMDIELDDKNQIIYGRQTVTYHNFSPDQLTYLWLQLDQNIRAKDSDRFKTQQSKIKQSVTARTLDKLNPDFEGGFRIVSVTGDQGEKLDFIINRTMMRISLNKPLRPGESIRFHTKWWYNINDRMEVGGRSGYEYFSDDDNYLYTIAQFYPRMCMYSDVHGWQNKQFLGRGEFTLSFGDYDVKITVPEDHLVASTGLLQNPDKVLTPQQQARMDQARNSFIEPVLIATEREARARERKHLNGVKTWHFKADRVRDFAFASS